MSAQAPVAIVTGGGKGLGFAAARALIDEGLRVVLTDVDEIAGMDAAVSLGPNARFIVADVTTEDDWQFVVESVSRHERRIDVLVNNAGVMAFSTIEKMSVDDYVGVIRVNQLGVYLGIAAVAPSMAAGGGGSIVNVVSIASLSGNPATAAYTSSKWAARGMTKSAALELAPMRIRVNAVHPGVMDTPLTHRHADAATIERAGRRTPLGRIAEPAEVAAAIAFLASPRSAYVTGADVVVDGGMSL